MFLSEIELTKIVYLLVWHAIFRVSCKTNLKSIKIVDQVLILLVEIIAKKCFSSKYCKRIYFVGVANKLLFNCFQLRFLFS